MKDVYGNDYAETHPETVTLKIRISQVFQAKSKKTVNKRYRAVMALKEEYVAWATSTSRSACNCRR